MRVSVERQKGRTMNTQNKVHEIITSLLRRRGDASPIADTDSLVLTGRVDSLGVMEIAGFLEKAFGVDFARYGFDPIEFDSVESIVAVIHRASPHG
jgi:acyl carrier protein